jgi:iron complex transport system substrate-binding protein
VASHSASTASSSEIEEGFFMARRLLLSLIVLVVAGCGAAPPVGEVTTTVAETPSTTAPAPTTTEPSPFPVEVRGVTIPQRPERILSGSAAHTEILFALGAGDQLAAVDLWSDHPPQAEALPRFDAFDASVEAMAALAPDLVVLTFDPGVVAGLRVLDIPTLVLDAPRDIEDMFAQYGDLGRAVGRDDEAAALIAEVRSALDAVAAATPDEIAGLTYYHELDPSLFSVGSDTFVGSVYGLLGLTSIADPTGGGYIQLSAEFIVDADPSFIFLADAECCGQTPDTVAARPGWGSLSAVAAGRVFAVDESMSSRWGPRIVDFLQGVVDLIGGESP